MLKLNFTPDVIVLGRNKPN